MANPDPKITNIVIHPDALEGMDEETKAALMAELSQVLVPGGLEAMLAKSRRVYQVPEDNECPVCHTPLVLDQEWANEYECPNPQCECYKRVSFVSEQEASLIQARAEAFDEHRDG